MQVDPMSETMSEPPRRPYDQPGLERKLGPVILCLGRLLRRRLEQSLAEAGLDVTPAQARVLVALHFGGPMNQHELAGHIDVEPSTLVGALDVMEREGLARREPNPGDRRAHQVHLTEAGAERVPRLFALWDAVEEALAGGLDPDERAALRERLSGLIDRLTDADRAGCGA